MLSCMRPRRHARACESPRDRADLSVIIAIDGPAASGKSTVARALAKRLDAGYLDTGAMYRAVAAEALRRGVEVFRQRCQFPCIVQSDATTEIRQPAVDAAVSPVSAVPGVRAAMVRVQRRIGNEGLWVVEGRDIGTVVFPDAPVKVFLTASAEERARRREIDMRRLGLSLGADDVQKRLEARDEYDSSREASPLTAAKDAVRLDTTGLSADEVVSLIAGLVEADPR
jgi:cytidylate kinase